MAKVLEEKAKFVLHSVGNREPLKVFELETVVISADTWFAKRRIWRCTEGTKRGNAAGPDDGLKSFYFGQRRRENFLSFR